MVCGDRAVKEFSITIQKSGEEVAENGVPIQYAGDWVRGVMRLETVKGVEALWLELSFIGGAYVTWIPNAGETADEPFAKEVYIKEANSMWKASGEEGAVLPAGLYEYNFEYLIPKDAPQSMLTKTLKGLGVIVYTLKAELVLPGSFTKSPQASLEVPVRIRVPLSNYPLLALGTTVCKEKRFTFLWKRNLGKVIVEVELPRQGYVRGEVVELKLNVSNKTKSTDVKRISVQLVSNALLFNAGGAKYTRVLFNTKPKEILKKVKPGGTLKGYVEAVTLSMPKENFCPTMPKDRCFVFQVEHIIRVRVGFSGIHNQIVLDVPLILGTAGFDAPAEPILDHRKLKNVATRSVFHSTARHEGPSIGTSMDARSIGLGPTPPSSVSDGQQDANNPNDKSPPSVIKSPPLVEATFPAP